MVNGNLLHCVVMQPSEIRELVSKRADVLQLITGKPVYKRDIVEKLHISRATVDRAVSDLQNANLVIRTGKGVTTTRVGDIALKRYKQDLSFYNGVSESTEFLKYINDTDILPDDLFIDAEVIPTEGPVPVQPVRELSNITHPTPYLRAVVTGIDQSIMDDLQLLVEQDTKVELVTTQEVIDGARKHLPEETMSLFDVENPPDIYVTDLELPFTVWLTEHNNVDYVGVLVFCEFSTPIGLIYSKHPPAVSWGEYVFERCKGASDPLNTG